MKDEEFEALVATHYEHLYRFALNLSRHDSDARDLVQQTFLRWAQRGFQLRERAKAKTWLFTTLYREFLATRRQSSRAIHVELDEAGGELPIVESDTVAQMDGQAVLEALQSLNENYRAPLTLFYLRQHSYVEIADILQVPIGTVMSRLSRGKEQLRKLLSQDADATPTNVVPFPGTHREAASHD
jgi:RNA polymerase sigma factor (sigma-70 family)